ncbi:MAG: hypothetical protein JWO00_621 [Candidatus Parcubacteria bacterium]|nr:hypothetical protein [Candidatus Parcubacteria bacterium]
MTLSQILHSFTEGMKKRLVIWLKIGYEEVRDDHPEVETHFEVVKTAIEDPHFVKLDKDYGDRNNYYAPFSGGRDYPNHHMKVVIEKGWFGKLRVITAFFVDHFKTGETIIWTKN